MPQWAYYRAMLGALRFHANIPSGDGMSPVPWTQSRPVAPTHARNQTAFGAVRAAAPPRRSVRTTWKALRAA